MPKPPSILILTNVAAPKATRELVPGLYRAEPYSMLVLVPPRADPGMAKPAPPAELWPGDIMEPPLRLIPRAPLTSPPPPKVLREPKK